MAGPFVLEFEVEGGQRTVVYWYGSPAPYELGNGVYVTVLEVLKGNGRLVANIRLEVDKAAGGIKVYYITPPAGGEPPFTSALSLLPGQGAVVYGTKDEIRLLDVDRTLGTASLSVSKMKQAFLVIVEGCDLNGRRGWLQLANVGSGPAPAANATIADNASRTVGIVTVDGLLPGARVTAPVNGRLERGSAYILKYPDSESSFTC
jgi:hypothetical protein